jgi:hypothetical protein
MELNGGKGKSNRLRHYLPQATSRHYLPQGTFRPMFDPTSPL